MYDGTNSILIVHVEFFVRDSNHECWLWSDTSPLPFVLIVHLVGSVLLRPVRVVTITM
jgi:hypothetical protein